MIDLMKKFSAEEETASKSLAIVPSNRINNVHFFYSKR
jgi:hypothetical protein